MIMTRDRHSFQGKKVEKIEILTQLFIKWELDVTKCFSLDVVFRNKLKTHDKFRITATSPVVCDPPFHCFTEVTRTSVQSVYFKNPQTYIARHKQGRYKIKMGI